VGAETSAKRFQLGPFHLGRLQSGMLPLSYQFLVAAPPTRTLEIARNGAA
jgi:hypothetical protein